MYFENIVATYLLRPHHQLTNIIMAIVQKLSHLLIGPQTPPNPFQASEVNRLDDGFH